MFVNADAAQVAVLEGTLGGSGSVGIINVYDGTVNPGDGIGELASNNFEMRDGSTLEIEVSPGAADKLAVNGPAIVDGLLKVEGGSYTPAMRGDIDQFVVLTATSVDGDFDDATYNGTDVEVNGNLTHADDGLFVGVGQSGSDVSLEFYYAIKLFVH